MKIALKIGIGLILIVVTLLGLSHWRFNQLAEGSFSPADTDIDSFVENGDLQLGHRIYAVRSGCIDCHGVDLAGVKIMEDPAMGTIYGANITPFNLDAWSNDEIAKAIRYGVHKSGRSLKFMPSFDYKMMSKSDVGSLIAYMRSVEEVQTPSQSNTFGPIAKILTSLKKMPVMYPAYFIDQEEGFFDKPEEAPTKDFGQYLAYSCVGCHGEDYTGGAIAGGDPSWPEATDIRFGSNPFWTEEKFEELIKTGVSPRSGKELRPPMPINLLKQFNETEIKALWLFLSELK